MTSHPPSLDAVLAQLPPHVIAKLITGLPCKCWLFFAGADTEDNGAAFAHGEGDTLAVAVMQAVWNSAGNSEQPSCGGTPRLVLVATPPVANDPEDLATIMRVFALSPGDVDRSRLQPMTLRLLPPEPEPIGDLKDRGQVEQPVKRPRKNAIRALADAACITDTDAGRAIQALRDVGYDLVPANRALPRPDAAIRR